MSYYYIPKPPVAYTVYVPQQCYTAQQCLAPQPPEVYYQPPPQYYCYQPPATMYAYQPPAQVYQPPPQYYFQQAPAQTYAYQPPAEKCLCQDGDARMFRELGIPPRDFRRPTLF